MMNHKTMLRYVITLSAGVFLLFLAVPGLTEATSDFRSFYPFMVFFGLGIIFIQFVKRYRQQRPTTLLNFVQLGYIATLVIALYFSIVTILNLF